LIFLKQGYNYFLPIKITNYLTNILELTIAYVSICRYTTTKHKMPYT
uniref:Very-long-chain 3-oxoacyl-CoA synthase n=1 Tax=Haemonchus placei TaxID=6290 RepID=A0A0N4WM27_HAEPC